jgi:plastocyanin
MHRRSLTLLAVCAISVAALGSPIAASAAGAEFVTLKRIAFSPGNLTVSRATTVTFRFRDGTTAHNVTSRGSRRFKSIADRSTGSVARTFARAGVYRYACTLHPGMTGKLTVR